MKRDWSAVLAAGVVAVFSSGLAFAQSAEPTGRQTALVGGRLIDGFGGEPVNHSVILVQGDRIVDRETGSGWDLLGRAVSGPLKGERLPPAEGGVHFAFAWLAFNPESEIYGRN